MLLERRIGERNNKSLVHLIYINKCANYSLL